MQPTDAAPCSAGTLRFAATQHLKNIAAQEVFDENGRVIGHALARALDVSPLQIAKAARSVRTRPSKQPDVAAPPRAGPPHRRIDRKTRSPLGISPFDADMAQKPARATERPISPRRLDPPRLRDPSRHSSTRSNPASRSDPAIKRRTTSLYPCLAHSVRPTASPP